MLTKSAQDRADLEEPGWKFLTGVLFTAIMTDQRERTLFRCVLWDAVDYRAGRFLYPSAIRTHTYCLAWDPYFILLLPSA